MMQNINLLTTLPVKPKRYLRAEYLLGVMAGWVFLLLLFYVIHFFLVSREQGNLNKLISVKNTMVKNITALNKQQNEPQPSRQNISAVLVSLLEKQTTDKFSRYMEGLANATPYGLWLNEIVFSNIENDIVFTGNAVSARLIPQFLRNLNKNHAFAGKKFSALRLEKKRQKHGGKFMEFILSTKTDKT